jgi:uncharacterized protein (TIGR00299 family) protein
MRVLPVAALQGQLQGLPGELDFTLTVQTVQRQGQRATQVQVHPQGEQPHHRHWEEIRTLLERATLPPQVRQWSQAIFERLAVAEGTVHGIPPEAVGFHEVGAVDAIVDIVGTCIGLHYFNITHFYCSPLPLGSGMVKTAHGMMPVPTPAVLQLCAQKQVPVYDNGIVQELVTPTGAAIVTTLAQGFGRPPAFKLERVGWGAGGWELPIANILRLWVGSVPSIPLTEPVVSLETQVDDLSPQGLAYACERLLAAGGMGCVDAGDHDEKGAKWGVGAGAVCPGTGRWLRRNFVSGNHHPGGAQVLAGTADFAPAAGDGENRVG